MSIYLVQRSDQWHYDEFDEFVVRANSEREAQLIAYEESKNEGFLDGAVVKITPKGKAGVILGSFNRG